MNLKIYSKQILAECSNLSDIRAIRISTDAHSAWFNACATRELELQTGQRVLFAQDTDTKHWYFTFGFDLTDGAKIRAVSKHTKCMRCCCKQVAQMICAQVKSESITCGIAKEPKVIDGLKWYRILTSTPIRVK